MMNRFHDYMIGKIIAWYLKKFYAMPHFEDLYTSFSGSRNEVEDLIDPANPRKRRKVWGEMWEDLMAVKNRARLVGYLEKNIILMLKEMHFDKERETKDRRMMLLVFLRLKQEIELANRIDKANKGKTDLA